MTPAQVGFAVGGIFLMAAGLAALLHLPDGWNALIGLACWTSGLFALVFAAPEPMPSKSNDRTRSNG